MEYENNEIMKLTMENLEITKRKFNWKEIKWKIRKIEFNFSKFFDYTWLLFLLQAFKCIFKPLRKHLVEQPSFGQATLPSSVFVSFVSLT